VGHRRISNVTLADQTLLQRLNDNGLWRNPLRLRILSCELGISIIALKGKMNYRRIIRGPYIIDDREHKAVPVSKRSQLLKSYTALSGDPRSKISKLAKKFRLTERQVRAKLEAACGAQWYRREFDTASLEERARLVKLLNRKGRWKSGGVIGAVAKELGVSKASLTLKMSRWSIVRGPYVQLRFVPKDGPSKPEQYARAFEQSRGNPETRIRRIAKENGVASQTVKIALREFWGPKRYRREVPLPKHGHDPHALVALMNEPKIRNSNDALSAAAKRLGIKRQSLMSILSRKGVRRIGRRYVWDDRRSSS